MKPVLDYFSDSARPSLRSYFGRVREGQPVEYRTPFAGGDSVQSVLEDWSKTLNQLEARWPSLVNFENDMRSKVGPMSIMKPLSERMDDIESYYTSVRSKPEAVNESAVKSVLHEFQPIRGLRVRSQQKTLDKMKLSTNSGSPYFTKRKYVVADTIPVRLSIDSDNVIYQYLAEGKAESERYECCAVLGWRGQEGGPNKDDVKQRVVWMFPFGVNICELQVYQPLIEACQRSNLVPAWISMQAVDTQITKLFSTKDKDQLVICTDFSKFDQHFNTSLQHCAGTLLDNIFTQDDMYTTWRSDVFPVKYMIPLMYDMGRVKYGFHGMGSGSGGTNADETLAHRALQHEAAISNNRELNINSQCLGDDGILSFPGCSVDAVLQSYTRHGLEMNTDKQYASTEDCVYLRRWHHRDYIIDGRCAGVYSTYRAIGRLMEQERYYENWSREMVALRQLSIIENVCYHPLREQFAEFCMKRDKYRLGVDIPGFLKHLGMYASEAIDNMPDFLGYSRSLGEDNPAAGIANWWIVKYLQRYS